MDEGHALNSCIQVGRGEDTSGGGKTRGGGGGGDWGEPNWPIWAMLETK
jgi:hypothetical protein